MDAVERAAQLVGAWTLESYESRLLDGTDVQYPLGPDAIGIIMYTPDGYMSAQIMRTDRPRFPGYDPRHADETEFASAAQDYFAYSGPYTVTEDGNEVHHHLTVSLLPNWVGSVQARVVALDGDRLRLSTAAPLLVNDEQRSAHLVWRRARERASTFGLDSAAI